MIRGSQDRTAQTSRAVPVAAAVLVHGLLLLTFARGSRVSVAPMRFPGSALGTQMSLTYLPGHPSPPARLAAVARLPAAHRVTPASVPIPNRTALSSSQAPTAAENPDATQGNDALGTGDVNIALATFFPTPRPDLSSLPNGTSGDVVLEIVIDASGKVTNITVSRGLGHGVDEVVIATVSSWSFHPATRDRQPVPSEQELHFHYEKA